MTEHPKRLIEVDAVRRTGRSRGRRIPSLAGDDIEASIAYAAELARERVVPLSPGAA